MSISKSIGIKLYNGDFLPLLEEGNKKIKKVVLTTVRDDQKKSIIELYEGTGKKSINNEYLGKLEIPINRSTVKGDPAIELHLRLDDQGILFAKAWDLDSNEESEIQIEHSLNKTILPETETHKKIDIDEEITKIDSYSDYEDYEKRDFIKKVILIIALFIILALLSLGIFLGVKKLIPFIGEKINSKDKNKTVMVKETEKIQEKKEELLKEKPEEAKKEEAKEQITGLKEVEGQKYFVKWGDNLWNICKTYYGDPWYYPALAEANPQIPNPRLIFAGTYITIPPKSSLKRWEFE